MYQMVGFELLIVIYLLLVCFVVFEWLDKWYIEWGGLMVFNAICNIISVWWLLMSDVACVSGLPIISLTFS